MESTKFILLLLLALCIACNGIDFSEGAPKCLKEELREYKKNACKDLTVDEYNFQNMTVFVFDASHCCCDIGSAVLDDECNHIGSLGGFSGNSIINGEEFSNATYIRTIWDK